MIKLSGIFSESLGGTCTIRGYAKYNDIVGLSYPHPGYQRPQEDKHVDEISQFITSGSNSFSPEVVLAYTAKYDYYAAGHSENVNALADIRSGKGFSSNVDGIVFKKDKVVENGYLYTVSIPERKYEHDTEKPFRRVDGNHRLLAIEKLISDGQMRSVYLIPFCIIVFADGTPLKDEKVIFHNINSKAVQIHSEQLLNSILTDTGDGLSFSDSELRENFGKEYVLARKIINSKPLTIRKLHSISWVRPNKMSTLVHLINYTQKRVGEIDTLEKEDAFGNALNSAISHAKTTDEGKKDIASGLFFLLTALYYQIEISSVPDEIVHNKNSLASWAERYQITAAQANTEENAVANAECIESIFNRYIASCEQTIFMSRCFLAGYDENENAIRRAIKEINDEKNINLKLIRVDEHTYGTTGQISDRVLKEIERSGLVIADLSSGKLNIPHEIGYAMGQKKDLIIIHNGTDEQAEEHTPSNIKMFEQIRFNGDYQTLQDRIKKCLIDYYKI